MDAYYPGTGDLFSSVLTGGLVRGEPLAGAVRRAADFVRACIEHTEAAQNGGSRLFGVQFEPLLLQLAAQP